MRKIALLAAFAAVAGASAAYAQNSPQAPEHAGVHAKGGPGRRGGPGGGDRMLLRGISLTEAQKAKLQEMHKAELATMKASGAQRPARAERIATIRNILTGDQVAKFDANVAQMKQHQGGRKGRPSAL